MCIQSFIVIYFSEYDNLRWFVNKPDLINGLEK